MQRESTQTVSTPPEANASAMAPEQQVFYLSALLQLEKQVRQAATPAELGFIMVNETLRLIDYRQAVCWHQTAAGRVSVEAVSGVDRPDSNAPYTLFLKDLIRRMQRSPDPRKIRAVAMDDLPQKFHSGWREWSIGKILWCPLTAPTGELLGGLVLSRPSDWAQSENTLAERLCDAYAHAFWALRRRQGGLRRRVFQPLKKSWVRLALAFVVVAALFAPVRLSVLAPVEIVAKDPLVVSSPMEGVIKQFHVNPNQAVQKGQLLVSLDDTRIRNEHAVARKALEVSKADYRRARQKAFRDADSKSDLLVLSAQIKLKTAEMTYMAELLQRSRIRAEKNGIAVFGDVSDWIGKPLAVGEKMMIIADPDQVEAEIQLPVEDAINIENGAEVLVFLNISPGQPYTATLSRAAYEAQVTPGGPLAFRLRATLTDQAVTPRIGLRGTAKIYGADVILAYYLMRRPLAAMRQFLGM